MACFVLCTQCSFPTLFSLVNQYKVKAKTEQKPPLCLQLSIYKNSF